MVEAEVLARGTQRLPRRTSPGHAYLVQIESLYNIHRVMAIQCRTTLSAGQTLPGDRRYALSAGSLKAAQADDGVWLQKPISSN